MRAAAALRALAITSGLVAGCGGGGGSSDTMDTQTGVGSAGPGTGTSTTGDTTSGDGLDDSGATCSEPCGDTCCPGGQVCDETTLTCAPLATDCVDDTGCSDDHYCDEAAGVCTPWGDGEFDSACGTEHEPGIFRVSVACEWTAPPAGDPAPGSASVPSMPLVVDFGFPGPAHSTPSIVFTTQGGGNVIRVIDGASCTHQYTLDDHAPTADSTPAVGDLDGDGRAEIVAHLSAGGIAAWTYDEVLDDFVVLFRSADTTPSGVHSISLGDLDDDGAPEIVVGAIVYAADGTLRSTTAGQGDTSCGGGYHNPPVLADVDLDDRLELVQGTSVWTWDDAIGDLVPEPYAAMGGASGFAGVADFGDFPGQPGDAPGRAEIVVMSPGALRIQTIGGATLFAPGTLPGGGNGGNVTIADFDGDGAPEIGVVGLTQFVVYDPACGDATWAGVCGTARTDGILWTQTIDENSCAIMGSTVFDFEGDGAAEVLYADECYVRVMRGTDGAVMWSHPRSSASWYEAPIVADVDGDQLAEMVVPIDPYAGGGCPGTDPIFEGIRCSPTAACPGGLPCDGGLCRCVADADCGDADLSCTAPLPQSAGAGNVCRSVWTARAGLRVYADDNWAGSRPVWNQHAYSVTHIDDAGVVPAGPAMDRNWQVPGLNNFRQNVQAGLAPVPAVDLTVQALPPAPGCSVAEPALDLLARVCNRGPLPAPAPVDVGFHDGVDGPVVCSTTTTQTLFGGDCEEVGCTWDGAPINMPLTIQVIVDGADDVVECLDDNNDGYVDTQCPPPPQG